MKLFIDSAPVELPAGERSTFSSYCRDVMQHLLGQNLAISSFAIDGRPMLTIEQAEEEFARAGRIEIATMPLAFALRASLQQQVDSLQRAEEQCSELVTESLLAEPEEIASRWHALCDSIKVEVRHLPQVAGLLSEIQIDDLAERRLAAFNHTMRDIASALNRADVVAFSDILEFRLLPWLQELRQFIHEQISRLDVQPAPSPVA